MEAWSAVSGTTIASQENAKETGVPVPPVKTARSTLRLRSGASI